MKLVLASNSPRRRQLLEGLDIPFEVRLIEGIDESCPIGTSAEEMPALISRKKAAAYVLTDPDEVLITADTVVAVDGMVLGKPYDMDEAHAMLRILSNRSHEVITGVTLRGELVRRALENEMVNGKWVNGKSDEMFTFTSSTKEFD